MASPKKPPEFHAARRLQREYEKGIREITGRVVVRKRREQTFQEWLAEITERSRRRDVQEAAETLARRMVKWANAGNVRTWREAARRSTQSQKLHRLLEAEMEGPTGARVAQLVRENAALISSLSIEAAQTLADEVTRAQRSGARPKTVAKMAQKRFPELLRSRVHLISRTETQKASSALTRARAEALSLDWYEWLDVSDQRTRPSHRNMHGVLVAFSDPPSPEALVGENSTLGKYNAGECPNCRCVTAPLLALSDANWPHRVYHGGTVKTMTLPQFKLIAANMEEPVAA